MDKKGISHLPWLTWLSILITLSLLPGDNLPEIKFELFKLDKVVHFIFYSVLAYLMLLGFKIKKNEPFLKHFVLIIVVGIFIGYFIELIQGNLITNRFFSYSDIIANSIGSVFGSLGFVKYHNKKY